MIALCVVIGASAQKFGVKVGGTMSGYTVNFFSPEGSYMSKGINVAAISEFALGEKFAIRADLGFNQLGSDYDSRNETDANWPARAYYEYDYKQAINYMQLGVSPKMNFGPAYAFVGPYFGYAISSAEKVTITPTAGDVQSYTANIFDEPSTTFDYTKPMSDSNNPGGSGDLYSKLDVGFNLGLGANFSGILVEVNAGLGMTNFINTDSKYYDKTNYVTKEDITKAITDDASQKNLFMGLSVGYLFGGE